MSELTQVSVTEVSSFRECRRRWLLGTHKGYHLRSTAPELWFGEQIHAALQVYAEKGVEEAIGAWYLLFNNGIDEVADSYGGLWEQVSSQWMAYRDLGADMLSNYNEFVETMGEDWETVQLEQRLWVPVREPSTMRKGKWKAGADTDVNLTARMDRVVAIEDDLYLVDYKSGSPPNGRALEVADQPTGYSYVYWRVTDELPMGMFIEHLVKKVPTEPRILNTGKLSTAKNQNTTADMYRATMKRMKLMRSPAHLECLAALEVKGWDRYFEREMTQRNFEQLMRYEEHLYFIVEEMKAVVEDERKAYPSPSQMRCPRCPFLNVCIAMEEGSDADWLLDQYEQSTERRW